MSRILESAIRKLLFEQNAKQTIQNTTKKEQADAVAAGAVASFKVVSRETDKRVNIKKSDTIDPNKILKKDKLMLGTTYSQQLSWFYSRNAMLAANRLVDGTNNVAGITDRLNDGKHVVLIGNTPPGKEQFSLLFWIFDLDTFLSFSTPKPKEGDVDTNLTGLSLVEKNTNKVGQAYRYTYDQYITDFNTTNKNLVKINQGVSSDIATILRSTKEQELERLINSADWPKQIDDKLYVNIIFNNEDVVVTTEITTVTTSTGNTGTGIEYLLWNFDEWKNHIKFIKNLPGVKIDSKPFKKIQPAVIKLNRICDYEKTEPIVQELNDKIDAAGGESLKKFDLSEWKTELETTIAKKNKDVQDKFINTYKKTYFENTAIANKTYWLNLVPKKYTSEQEWMRAVKDSISETAEALISVFKNPNDTKLVWNDQNWEKLLNIFKQAGLQYWDLIVEGIIKPNLQYHCSNNTIIGLKLKMNTADVLKLVQNALEFQDSNWENSYFDILSDLLSSEYKIIDPSELEIKKITTDK